MSPNPASVPNAPQQQQIIASAADGQNTVTALYQSAMYLAVSMSGALGALGLHVLGADKLPLLAAALMLLGLAMTALV